MRFTSEQRLDDGIIERRFTLGEIPGILWTPASASAPAPLILLGHPGGLPTMYPRLAARARHSAAEHGFAFAIRSDWSAEDLLKASRAWATAIVTEAKGDESQVDVLASQIKSAAALADCCAGTSAEASGSARECLVRPAVLARGADFLRVAAAAAPVYTTISLSDFCFCAMILLVRFAFPYFTRCNADRSSKLSIELISS